MVLCNAFEEQFLFIAIYKINQSFLQCLTAEFSIHELIGVRCSPYIRDNIIPSFPPSFIHCVKDDPTMLSTT